MNLKIFEEGEMSEEKIRERIREYYWKEVQKALLPYFQWNSSSQPGVIQILDSLIDEGVILRGEIEHRTYDDGRSPPYDATHIYFYEAQGGVEMPRQPVISGRYLFIGLPIKEEPTDVQS